MQTISDEIIQVPKRLEVFAYKPKRFKVLIGGRGSGKSETVASLFSAMVYQSGCRAVCCREYQTSIRQSVHSLVSRKIKEMDLGGFNILQAEITHDNGGDIVYQGLSRDPQAIKSIDEAELAWVEEAQSLSHESLEELTPSIRAKGSEIWFTANLGSSKDPFSQKFFKPFESELRRNGYYEDDLHLIVWINYYDNPWFPYELDLERQRDKLVMQDAEYLHKWHGEPSDTIPDAIIAPSWFDACIDAHEKLNFKPFGVEVVSFDPSDMGEDAKGLSYRHGNVFLDIQSRDMGDINEGCDWALDYAVTKKVDHFIWDSDGMGAGLRREINNALDGKKITAHAFYGMSAVDRPDEIYEEGETKNSKTNKETFFNLRSQKYWDLRDRCYKTWQAVKHGVYHNPEELVSFSSGIDQIDLVRAEVCRIPRKYANTGRIQIMSKKDMKSLGIDSPNTADAIMMSLKDFKTAKSWGKLNYPKRAVI